LIDWALPDQLVFSTVSALLRVSSTHPHDAERATGAIFAFISHLVREIETSTCESLQSLLFNATFMQTNIAPEILTQLAPSIHGLYRALISTSFSWTSMQWQRLSAHLSSLCAPSILDRLNGLLVDIIQQDSPNEEVVDYIQAFLSRYVSRGRPLSGYFVVCCVIETQWTVLAQALAPPGDMCVSNGHQVEAAAANRAWLSLMRKSALHMDDLSEATERTLREMVAYAMQCFTDLLTQLEEMDSEPSVDTYAWETMSESLVSGSLLEH
jgi:phosphatidylinositol 4-kinase